MADDLDRPSVKVGRPATGKNPVITLRSPERLTRQIEAYAARHGVPRAKAIRQLIVIGLRAERI